MIKMLFTNDSEIYGDFDSDSKLMRVIKNGKVILSRLGSEAELAIELQPYIIADPDSTVPVDDIQHLNATAGYPVETLNLIEYMVELYKKEPTPENREKLKDLLFLLKRVSSPTKAKYNLYAIVRYIENKFGFTVFENNSKIS